MRACLLSLLFVLNSAAWPQSAPQDATQGTTPTVLPADTVISLRTTQPIDSKHAKTNGAIPLEVTRDVKIGDLLVIAKHTPVMARLTRVNRAGRALRRGSMILGVDAVPDITGNAIPVSGTRSEKPDDKRQVEAYTYEILSMGMLTPLLLLRGDEAAMTKGTGVKAAVSKDVTLDAAALRQRMAALDAEARIRPRTGKATLHFYLYTMVKHTGENHVMWLDGNKLVRLREAHFFNSQIAPGHHTISCCGHDLPLDAKPDEDYYIRVAQSSDRARLTRPPWRPSLVDTDIGEDEAYPLLSADAKDTYPAPH